MILAIKTKDHFLFITNIKILLGKVVKSLIETISERKNGMKNKNINNLIGFFNIIFVFSAILKFQNELNYFKKKKSIK